MKANELRINNIVYNKLMDQVWNVIVVEREEDDNYTVLFDPIHLTADWLLRLCFTHNETHDNYTIKINNFTYSVKEEDGIFTFYKDDSDAVYYRICEVEYVHQLQNLVHSITGVELEVKELV